MNKYTAGAALGLTLAVSYPISAQDSEVKTNPVFDQATTIEKDPEIQRLHKLGTGLVEILSKEFDAVEFGAKCYPQYEYNIACAYEAYDQSNKDNAPLDLSKCKKAIGCNDPKLAPPFKYEVVEEETDLWEDIFKVFDCKNIPENCEGPSFQEKIIPPHRPAHTEWFVRGYHKTGSGLFPEWGINLKNYCDVSVETTSLFFVSQFSSVYVTTADEEIFGSPKMDHATANAAANLLRDNLSYNQKECGNFNYFMNQNRGGK